VGRASNRKKAQRQAGPKAKADAATQEAMLQLVTGLHALAEESRERQEAEAAASRIWSDRAEPVPARAHRWAGDSLGDRFFGGTFIEKARTAPGLATAQIPDAASIAAQRPRSPT
jgi:hypothetical protein